MGEDEGGLLLAIDVHEAVEHGLRELQRIVAGIEELDLRAENAGGFLRLRLALGLHLFKVTPATFQANWLSPRSPKDMHTIFTR